MAVIGGSINRLTGRPRLPVFGVGAVTASAWNPADKTANVTLSNSDRTATAATSPGAGDAGVRGVTFRGTGQFQFEITRTANGFVAGLVPAGWSTATDIRNAAGVVMDASGNVRVNGVLITTWDPVANGDTVTFRRDGASDVYIVQSSSPGSVRGPYTLPVSGGNYAPGAGAVNGNEVHTLNTGQVAFVSALPGGFSAWG